jgi:hypothetical protein
VWGYVSVPIGKDVFAPPREDVFAVLGRDIGVKRGHGGAVPDGALGGGYIWCGSLVGGPEGGAFDVLSLFDVWGHRGVR